MDASENPSINLAMESMISEQSQPMEETQNPRELIQLDSDAEVADEVEELDPQLHLNEIKLREVQRVDVVTAIDSLRIKPKVSSRFEVPLCRLIYMPLLRPTLQSDVKRIEAEFTHGYRPGSSVFYVSTTNERGEERFVTDQDRLSWGPVWNAVNLEFEASIETHPHLSFLKSRMLYVCDGNHRYVAWMGYIERVHKSDPKWHFLVDTICIDIAGRVGFALEAMYNVNRATENSHVKSNFVHLLHRIKATGSQSLEAFKEILSAEDYHKCCVNPHKGKTWYPLTVDVFVSYLFRQEISQASDDAARLYHEVTPEDERDDAAVTAAMRAAAKLKAHMYKGQWSKFSSIANPKLGDQFLDEITGHWSVNLKPEMTMDKLQLIATTNVPPTYKVKWLSWWNSSMQSREALHFPSKGFTDKDLDTWLHRATFWALVEEAVAERFEAIMKDDKLPI